MNRFKWRLLKLVSVGSLMMVFYMEACLTLTTLEYATLTEVLDTQNEIEISTYPAHFPNEVSYNKLVSHDSVYFQLFLKDRSVDAGQNPHVSSLKIHSFVYRLDDGPEVTLLEDFTYYFWMQGNEPENRQPPIPYNPNSTLSVEVDFTLNGTHHVVKGVMPAQETFVIYPSIIKYWQ